jgi:hypothetical protein
MRFWCNLRSKSLFLSGICMIKIVGKRFRLLFGVPPTDKNSVVLMILLFGAAYLPCYVFTSVRPGLSRVWASLLGCPPLPEGGKTNNVVQSPLY